MKTLITGIAGAGKSTIITELNKRGVDAVDLHDLPGLFFWQDKETKQRVEYSPVESRDWFDTVDRLCDIDRLKQLLEQYQDVVMAGTISGNNQKEFLFNFDKIILLQADPQTLIQRMQTRENKSGYGKTKAEQDDNIEWQKEFDPLLLSLGATPVSTEGELEKVVDRVIALLE